MDKARTQWQKKRRRVSEIIEAGTLGDLLSRDYDFLSTVLLLVNVAVTILYTFDEMELKYGAVFLLLEAITVAFLQWITFFDCFVPSFRTLDFLDFKLCADLFLHLPA